MSEGKQEGEMWKMRDGKRVKRGEVRKRVKQREGGQQSGVRKGR